MFNVLIDTCVWLDMAQDPRQTPLLVVVETMIKERAISLVVPRVVHDEFLKNRDRVAKASARSLSSHFQQVKEAVKKGTSNARRKAALITQLDDLNHRIPLIGGAAQGVLDRIDQLLREADTLDTTDSAKRLAAERALGRRAPCHHDNKNSIADAIVIEQYFEVVRKGRPGDRFAFVTHNTSDFSVANGSHKIPHADLAQGFSKIKSLYFVSLAELLRRIDPSILSEVMWEQMWQQEPRGLSEILEAEERLSMQVWYVRHKNRAWLVERGKIKIVPRDVWEKGARDNRKEFVDEIWQGALRAAKEVERKLGKEQLEALSDYDWGEISGKLSAIRWVLGDEWGMLDT